MWWDRPQPPSVYPGYRPNVEANVPGPLCRQQMEEGGVSVVLQEAQLRSHPRLTAQAADQQNALDHQLDRVHDRERVSGL